MVVNKLNYSSIVPSWIENNIGHLTLINSFYTKLSSCSSKKGCCKVQFLQSTNVICVPWESIFFFRQSQNCQWTWTCIHERTRLRLSKHICQRAHMDAPKDAFSFCCTRWMSAVFPVWRKHFFQGWRSQGGCEGLSPSNFKQKVKN